MSLLNYIIPNYIDDLILDALDSSAQDNEDSSDKILNVSQSNFESIREELSSTATLIDHTTTQSVVTSNNKLPPAIQNPTQSLYWLGFFNFMKQVKRLLGSDFEIDAQSVQAICKGSQEVVVYGFEYCLYEELQAALKRQYGIQVHDWRLCDEKEGEHVQYSGNDIQDDYKAICKATCKASLVDLVLTNYKRERENKPIIPLIFSIDIDGNEYSTTSSKINSKDPKDQFVTYAEIRRAYKLCEDPDVDPSIREVARKTFNFIKIKRPTSTVKDFSLEKQKAPWEANDWTSSWAFRKQTSLQSHVEKAREKTIFWREEIKTWLEKNT